MFEKRKCCMSEFSPFPTVCSEGLSHRGSLAIVWLTVKLHEPDFKCLDNQHE